MSIKDLTDRELDALVAEKVMGCKPDYEWSDACAHELADEPKCVECIPLCMCEGDKHGNPDLPNFSSSMADAWAVVGKMVELGCTSWCIADDEVYFEFPRVVNKPVPDWPEFGGVGHDGTNVPRAICLAALSTVSRPTNKKEGSK